MNKTELRETAEAAAELRAAFEKAFPTKRDETMISRIMGIIRGWAR